MSTSRSIGAAAGAAATLPLTGDQPFMIALGGLLAVVAGALLMRSAYYGASRAGRHRF